MARRHTGATPGHCALDVQPVQIIVARLQIGVMPVQPEFDVHPTQVPLTVSQTGVLPLQTPLVVHCAHAWDALHSGLADGQSAFVSHATQVWSVGSQMGALVPQSVAVTQPTQRCRLRLQIGAEPLQFALEVQPTHVCAALQAGAPPSQSVFVTHAKHV